MFGHALHIDLTLKIGSRKVEILSGDVRGIELDVQPWGFTGSVELWLDEDKGAGGKRKDPLRGHIADHELIEISLKIVPAERLDGRWVKRDVDALEVTGLITEKAWHEQQSQEVAGLRVLQRRYQLVFADRMQVLWRQHFPCELYIGQTFRKVVDEHVCGGIRVKHRCRELDVKEDLIYLGLGTDAAEASFYDLLLWRLEAVHGALLHDARQDRYTLADSIKATGKAEHIYGQEVTSLHTRLRAPRRHDVRVLNADAQDAKPQEIKIKEKIEGLRRDLLIRSPIARVKSDVVKAQRAWASQPELEVVMSLATWPAADLRPGTPLAFDGETWPTNLSHRGKAFRSRSLALLARARAAQAGDGLHDDVAGYDVELSCVLDAGAARHPHLPPYVRPRYPQLIEGFVVSEKGKEKELSYHVYENATTKLDEYKIKLPLFKGKQVSAPFEPGGQSGHFYFPAYKGERVLVALDFNRAGVDRFLDWRAGARLAKATQGDQLLMGLSEESSTSLEHRYQQDKPTFTVRRRNKKDTTLIQMSEGKMVIRLEERS